MQLTEHFTLFEMKRSRRHPEIPNEPSKAVVDCLLALCRFILEPLRQAWGSAIIVTSGYRCPELNRAVGGAHNSQHLLGQAADIVADSRARNYELGQLIIQLNLPFDQLIFEGMSQDGRSCQWIHVSYGPRNRRQIIYNKLKN